MSIDENVPPTMAYTSETMEAREYGIREAITRAQLEGMHNVELRNFEDHATHRMIYELRGHIYGHKVEDQTVPVPYEAVKNARVQHEWEFTTKGNPRHAVAFVTGSFVFGFGLALSLAPLWLVGIAVMFAAFCLAYDDRTSTQGVDEFVPVRVYGTATVGVQDYVQFPRLKVRYPDEFGKPQPVRFLSVKDNHTQSDA